MGPARLPERVLCTVAALLLLYLEPFWVSIGIAVLVTGVLVHLAGARAARRATAGSGGSAGETERAN